MTDTPDDLVKRLRTFNIPACLQAADRIEALESRQRVLREALTTIGHSLVCAPIDYADHNASELLRAGEIARAALAGDAP